ncbi:MAG: hypothetical protein ACRC33_03260 [Gemmataceae bacterium]
MSAIFDPPKPRLLVGSVGKALGRSHSTMLLEPQKKTAPSGGGDLASRFSIARMADSQR